MLSDAILACKNLKDLARLYLGMDDGEAFRYDDIWVRGIPHTWPTNNGQVLRHVFKLVQEEQDTEVLLHLEYFQKVLRLMGFSNIPMSAITARRAENAKVIQKLNWFPEGMEPD